MWRHSGAPPLLTFCSVIVSEEISRLKHVSCSRRGWTIRKKRGSQLSVPFLPLKWIIESDELKITLVRRRGTLLPVHAHTYDALVTGLTDVCTFPAMVFVSECKRGDCAETLKLGSLSVWCILLPCLPMFMKRRWWIFFFFILSSKTDRRISYSDCEVNSQQTSIGLSRSLLFRCCFSVRPSPVTSFTHKHTPGSHLISFFYTQDNHTDLKLESHQLGLPLEKSVSV